MKNVVSIFVLLVAAVLFAPGLSSAADSPEERGKALFNDPNFAGGTRACSSCHPGGKGLEKAAVQGKHGTPAAHEAYLAQTVNKCIVNAGKGSSLDPDSDKMKDMIAYIKSLSEQKPARKKLPGY